MPSSIPVDNVLGAFFIGVVLSSMCEATVNLLPKIDEMESDYMA
jgi:Kef-type K+ transport system membrane component KefB